MRVEQIMTTDVAFVRPDTPLKDVARMLADRSISGLPVVDDERRLVGIVSERDLLPRGPAEPARPGMLARLRGKPAGDPPVTRVAADVMSSPAIAIEPFWSIPGAAAMMRDHGVKRLPVIRGDRLVGIVSRADIVRAIARDDAEVQHDVRELVAFHQGLWSDSPARRRQRRRGRGDAPRRGRAAQHGGDPARAGRADPRRAHREVRT